MTVFELIVPFLVAALTIATAAVGVLCARVELRLAKRRRVTLENYRQNNHLFYISKDTTTTVITGGVALLSLVLMIICLCSPLIRVYAVALALLLVVNGAIVWLSLSRSKCARDVRMFDSYYVKVENLLSNKERTLANIKGCRRRVAELRERLEQTRAAFNAHLSRGLEGGFVPKLFAPLDKMLFEYSAEVDRFSAEIAQSFSDALLEFLRNNTQPELKILPLRAFDQHTVDELLDGVKSSFGTKIASDVITEVNSGEVKSARALGEIMTLLHGLEVVIEGETLKRFLRAAEHFADREQLMILLYRNRQIPVSMVIDDFIPDGWEWAFVPAMAIAYNRRELQMLLSELLRGDRSVMTERLIPGLELSHLDLIDGVIEQGGEHGGKRTAAVLRAGRLLLSHSYAVGNSANLYETLALLLLEHRTELGMPAEAQERIAEIVSSGSFVAAAEELSAFYTAAARRGSALADSAARVILQYLVTPGEPFLAQERLASALCEYRFTLSFADIATLRNLVCAWLLLKSGDEHAISVVMSELSVLPAFKGMSEPEASNPRALAREILDHLKEKDLVRLRSVLYRTEAGRCTLDAVLAL